MNLNKKGQGRRTTREPRKTVATAGNERSSSGEEIDNRGKGKRRLSPWENKEKRGKHKSPSQDKTENWKKKVKNVDRNRRSNEGHSRCAKGDKRSRRPRAERLDLIHTRRKREKSPATASYRRKTKKQAKKENTETPQRILRASETKKP